MADWRVDPGSGVLDRELRRNAMYGHAHDSSTPRGDRLDRTVPGAVLASAPRTPTADPSALTAQGWSKSVRSRESGVKMEYTIDSRYPLIQQPVLSETGGGRYRCDDT